MKSEQANSVSLCVYQDEAIGANSVPLTISGKDLQVKKSSDYFMNNGIVIELQLSEKNEILNIRLGPDLYISLATLCAGVEVGPLGLFPVHTLQVGDGFSAKEGGIVRFGFLKDIFTAKSVGFAAKRVLSKLIRGSARENFSSQNDLSQACESYFGSNTWGTFDITIRKNATGEWALYQNSKKASEKSIEKIVARFNVNRAGVALGIEEMYCE